MKVLLVNPPIREWARPNVFPFGLGYIVCCGDGKVGMIRFDDYGDVKNCTYVAKFLCGGLNHRL